ncbi:MAG: 5-bromo-4-chloroindolyl phosphate hydrolysis family protein [Oscillospiraceae bacterium]|jgi:hypothetical protein|nr:5-bromo-4-chloroindolyl phosphate hydrolysis family protein [Oscillospiraceae bacterium]
MNPTVKKAGSGTAILGALLMVVPLFIRLDRAWSLPFTFGSYMGWGAMAVLFGAGLRLLVRAVHKKAMSDRLRKLLSLFDSGRRAPMEIAAAHMGVNYSVLVQDIRAMQKYRLIKGLYADLIRRDIVFAGEGSLPAPKAGEESPESRPALKETYRPSAMPIYYCGFAFLIYAVFLPVYRPADFVIALIISLIVYFLTAWSSPQRTVIVEIPAEKPKPVSTGSQALDEMLEGMNAHVIALRKLDRAIAGKLDGPVADILKTTEQIVAEVKKRPGSAADIRQFFAYTLPTTINLLNSYDELSRQPVAGENIKTAMWRIESMMDTIVDAFRRQLDALFRDRALDIDVELDVMRQMVGATDIAKTLEDLR